MPGQTVRAFLYDAEANDREVGVSAELVQTLQDQHLLWVDVQERTADSIRKTAAAFGLRASSVDELLTQQAQPRIHNYGAYLQFNLLVAPGAIKSERQAAGADDTPGAPSSNVELEGYRFDIVVGRNWVLTVHDGAPSFLKTFMDQERGDTRTGLLSAQALVASLLGWHLESYFAEIGRLEAIIDRLDERVLKEPSGEVTLSRILAVRRLVSRLRRLLVAQRTVYYGLSHPDVAHSAGGAAVEHFLTLAARFERAVDEVEHARDLIIGSFELFTSRSSQQTNELVKALTFFTVIIGSTAAIAGLFGMNFDPPFFRSGSTGFFAVTLSLLVVALLAWLVGRRRGWI